MDLQLLILCKEYNSYCSLLLMMLLRKMYKGIEILGENMLQYGVVMLSGFIYKSSNQYTLFCVHSL